MSVRHVYKITLMACNLAELESTWIVDDGTDVGKTERRKRSLYLVTAETFHCFIFKCEHFDSDLKPLR